MSNDPALQALEERERARRRAFDEKLTRAYAQLREAIHLFYDPHPDGLNYHRSTIIDAFFEELDEVTGDND